MTALLTPALVSAHTGQTLDQATLDELEPVAVGLAEAALGRTLVAVERTAVLTSSGDGWAYVDGPVTAAADPDGEARPFEPHRVWFGVRHASAEVVYTVGYTTALAPAALVRGLALGVVQLNTPAAAGDIQVPVGAQSVTVGDIAIDRGAVPKTVGEDGGALPAGFEMAADLGAKACWQLATLRRVRPC